MCHSERSEESRDSLTLVHAAPNHDAIATLASYSFYVILSASEKSHETHPQPQGIRFGERRMSEPNPRRPSFARCRFRMLERRRHTAKISPFNGSAIAQIVEDLTRGRVRRSDGAHLDPDLRRDAITRAAGWRPIFGQAGAAQSHLTRHKIGCGDLFLFFGCFRHAEQIAGAFRFVRDAPKLHVIFGWLQVGSVARATNGLAAEIPWANGHPHLAAPERYKNNTLYFASDRLSSIGLDASGAGTFDRIRPAVDTHADRLELFCVAAAAMVRSERAPCPLLSLEADALDGLRDFDALAVRWSRPGIRARCRRVS